MNITSVTEFSINSDGWIPGRQGISLSLVKVLVGEKCLFRSETLSSGSGSGSSFQIESDPDPTVYFDAD